MSEQAKHTPGDWVAGEPAQHSGSINIRAADGSPVAMVPPGYGYPDREATARLIAAAPDLLAACKAALAYDAAIQKRVIDGAVDLMATGGAVAMGDDLDALYAAWIDAARAAVAKTEPTPAEGTDRAQG